MIADDERFLSCDYCGETPVYDYNDDGLCRIACECGLCGPWMETEEQAASWWNSIRIN